MPGRLRFSSLTLSLPTGEPLIVAVGSPPRVSKLGTSYAHHELRVSSYRLQTTDGETVVYGYEVVSCYSPKYNKAGTGMLWASREYANTP